MKNITLIVVRVFSFFATYSYAYANQAIDYYIEKVYDVKIINLNEEDLESPLASANARNVREYFMIDNISYYVNSEGNVVKVDSLLPNLE